MVAVFPCFTLQLLELLIVTLDFLFALEQVLFPIVIQGLLSQAVFTLQGNDLRRPVFQQAQLLLMGLLQPLAFQLTRL
ncbi:hypothetical protein D3C71_1825640 [compost metagenome]